MGAIASPRLAGATGFSDEGSSAAAGRAAVLAALGGRDARSGDLVIVFSDVRYDSGELYRAASSVAAPARVIGCTSTSSFTHERQVADGCVAALLPGDGVSFGVCHLPRVDSEIARTAQLAAQTARDRAGPSRGHEALLVLSDGLTPDQREIARGVYAVTTATVPFVGGAAGDNLTWSCTETFGDGRVLDNGILAVWINSERLLGVSVEHGWRPCGRPMLVTRAEGTIVHELDGIPAFEAYVAARGVDLRADDPELFHKVLDGPLGSPNARGRYDVRQLHAYLPEGGGINFNAGISEHSILRLMTSDCDSLVAGARNAAKAAVAGLAEPARLALVFSCGSRIPLFGGRAHEEPEAISAELGGVPVCGFYTYGEFARTPGSSGIHNSSVAVLAL
jgi:hypothetical protein